MLPADRQQHRPIMISSLKAKHLEKMDLYTGSRDFLRIFTDAANHIPRHRRTKFVACVSIFQFDPDDREASFRILLMS